MKIDLGRCKNLAISKNGMCMSKKYINSISNLKWKCNKDKHIWNASYSCINSGHWCPMCAKNIKKNINDCHKLVAAKNGKCLSTIYINARIPIEWECKDEHKWFGSYDNIKRGKWCPKCGILKAAESRKNTLQNMMVLAKNNEGLCLSKKYVNDKTNLLWQCKLHHTWMATPNNIRNGSWCPECSTRRSENMCKIYLKRKTGLEFEKCRPKWLKGLELDGYCKELNLAFEYNGRQHYKFYIYFHKNKKDFLDQQTRDKRKRKLCKQQGVKLITIPYYYNCYKPQKMYKFIDKQLK